MKLVSRIAEPKVIRPEVGSCMSVRIISIQWAWLLGKPTDSLLPRATAYNMPGDQVEGMDVIAVYESF